VQGPVTDDVVQVSIAGIQQVTALMLNISLNDVVVQAVPPADSSSTASLEVATAVSGHRRLTNTSASGAEVSLDFLVNVSGMTTSKLQLLRSDAGLRQLTTNVFAELLSRGVQVSSSHLSESTGLPGTSSLGELVGIPSDVEQSSPTDGSSRTDESSPTDETSLADEVVAAGVGELEEEGSGSGNVAMSVGIGFAVAGALCLGGLLTCHVGRRTGAPGFPAQGSSESVQFALAWDKLAAFGCPGFAAQGRGRHSSNPAATHPEDLLSPSRVAQNPSAPITPNSRIRAAWPDVGVVGDGGDDTAGNPSAEVAGLANGSSTRPATSGSCAPSEVTTNEGTLRWLSQQAERQGSRFRWLPADPIRLS